MDMKRNPSRGLRFGGSSNGRAYWLTGIGDCKDTNIILPVTHNGKPVLGIDNEVFCDCSSLTSVNIPDSFTYIGYRAFYGCDSLTDVYYNGTAERFYLLTKGTAISPDATIHCGDGITMKMDEMPQYFSIYANRTPSEGLKFCLNEDGQGYSVTDFGNCRDFDIVIPATYNNKPVTRIAQWSLIHHQSLTNVVLPDTVTSIGPFAFYGCISLKRITIPNSVTVIDSAAFAGCNALKNIAIPESVTNINSEAFYECTSLTSIVIPESVTSIGDGAFNGCTSLKSVNIPKGVTSIGECTFHNCESLTSLTIPDGVTSIGDWAFENCDSLVSITIPKSVTDIGWDIFHNCDALQDIYYDGTASDFYNLMKLEGIPLEAQMHFPDGDCTFGELQEHFDRGDDPLE